MTCKQEYTGYILALQVRIYPLFFHFKFVADVHSIAHSMCKMLQIPKKLMKISVAPTNFLSVGQN